jgi:hypothetical protein
VKILASIHELIPPGLIGVGGDTTDPVNECGPLARRLNPRLAGQSKVFLGFLHFLEHAIYVVGVLFTLALAWACGGGRGQSGESSSVRGWGGIISVDKVHLHPILSRNLFGPLKVTTSPSDSFTDLKT